MSGLFRAALEQNQKRIQLRQLGSTHAKADLLWRKPIVSAL